MKPLHKLAAAAMACWFLALPAASVVQAYDGGAPMACCRTKSKCCCKTAAHSGQIFFTSNARCDSQCQPQLGAVLTISTLPADTASIPVRRGASPFRAAPISRRAGGAPFDARLHQRPPPSVQI